MCQIFTITRVFTTSSGVVTAAAIPPDIEPAIPASHGSAIRFLPEYTPLKPPVALNPFSDCKRVFIVSKGNNAVSTDVPAIPPAY
ncbi:hypothetical protein AYI70_g2700 [Smittium culicis]|uniref:Uncharacterized protein n=1 Tax=Smittium culicis TaxID=133412 RepID=A0A1R1Y6Y0_9FUNG|nr:hypothetical protein AYI70_g2700 [Smittium culicis]